MESTPSRVAASIAILPCACAATFSPSEWAVFNYGFDLVVFHELAIGVVADGQHAARRHDLDQVDAFLAQPAHDAARIRRTVDDVVRHVGPGERRIEAVAAVIVAPSGAERRSCHPQARAFDDAGSDRLLERDDGAQRCPHVARAGEARQQRAPRIGRRPHGGIELRPRRPFRNGIAAVGLARQMHMAVDQTRQHRLMREIDDGGAGRRREARLDRNDAVVMDEDRNIGLDRLVDAVDEPPGMDDDIAREGG